jgi:hypothetical protein
MLVTTELEEHSIHIHTLRTYSITYLVQHEKRRHGTVKEIVLQKQLIESIDTQRTYSTASITIGFITVCCRIRRPEPKYPYIHQTEPRLPSSCRQEASSQQYLGTHTVGDYPQSLGSGVFVFHRVRVNNLPITSWRSLVFAMVNNIVPIFASTLLRQCPVNAVHSSSPSSGRVASNWRDRPS